MSASLVVRLSHDRRLARFAVRLSLIAALATASATVSAAESLAPGFESLPKTARLVVMPVDAELYSMTAGGLLEPRADWTAAAQTHMQAALKRKTEMLGLPTDLLDEAGAEPFVEQIGLYAAVAQSIALHHAGLKHWRLPSKNGQLDWSFEDAMKPIAAQTGARYGLFLRVRDSYASAERKTAMVALAVLGVGITLGHQSGYAALVDLENGRVLWFNRTERNKGDLREAKAAEDSIDELLSDFPEVQ